MECSSCYSCTKLTQMEGQGTRWRIDFTDGRDANFNGIGGTKNRSVSQSFALLFCYTSDIKCWECTRCRERAVRVFHVWRVVFILRCSKYCRQYISFFSLLRGRCGTKGMQKEEVLWFILSRRSGRLLYALLHIYIYRLGYTLKYRWLRWEVDERARGGKKG